MSERQEWQEFVRDEYRKLRECSDDLLMKWWEMAACVKCDYGPLCTCSMAGEILAERGHDIRDAYGKKVNPPTEDAGMSETKFTPGPWEWGGPDYDKEHSPPENCASAWLGGNGREVLCGCGDCGNIFYNEADGHLISAAPEMYEALEDCINVLTDPVVGTINHDQPRWYEKLYKAAAKAQAAIAKARGEKA